MRAPITSNVDQCTLLYEIIVSVLETPFESIVPPEVRVSSPPMNALHVFTTSVKKAERLTHDWHFKMTYVIRNVLNGL